MAGALSPCGGVTVRCAVVTGEEPKDRSGQLLWHAVPLKFIVSDSILAVERGSD